MNQLLEDEVDPISRQSDEPRVPDQLPPEPEASRSPPEPALEPQSSEPTPGEPPVEASQPEAAAASALAAAGARTLAPAPGRGAAPRRGRDDGGDRSPHTDAAGNAIEFGRARRT